MYGGQVSGLGVLVRDAGLLPDALQLVQVAEELGVDEVWQTEAGPQRDALVADPSRHRALPPGRRRHRRARPVQ
jgi:hypothetical protein